MVSLDLGGGGVIVGTGLVGVDHAVACSGVVHRRAAGYVAHAEAARRVDGKGHRVGRSRCRWPKGCRCCPLSPTSGRCKLIV